MLCSIIAIVILMCVQFAKVVHLTSFSCMPGSCFFAFGIKLNDNEKHWTRMEFTENQLI